MDSKTPRLDGSKEVKLNYNNNVSVRGKEGTDIVAISTEDALSQSICQGLREMNVCE